MALRRGAKSKLTPEIQKMFTDAFSVGTPIRLACQYAGVSEATYFHWMARAVAGEKPYTDFSESVEKSQGRAVVGWLAKIEAAANEGSWQAAAWKLERRYPEEFGRVIQDHHVSGEKGGPVEIKVVYQE